MATTIPVSILDDAVIEGLRRDVRGPVVTPADAEYDTARRVWNGMIDKRPGAIVHCTSTADVVAAVNLARDHGLLLAIRGGGHNVAGNALCDGGIVIDLSRMKGIQVDPHKRTVRAQGGVVWNELDRETQLHGLATPGGEVSMTGIAGYTLSGGMGLLQRKWGMACDNLLSAEIVTADGEVLRASITEHPDLFWAVRGGGGNFGVVTWFEFLLHPLGPEIYSSAVIYSFDDAPALMRGWRDFALNAPDEVTSEVLFWGMPPLPDVPEEFHGAPIIVFGGLYAGDAGDGERALAPLSTLGEPLADLSGRSSYVESQCAFDDFFPPGLNYYWKSLFLDSMNDDTIDAIIDVAASRPAPSTLVALRHLGGAVNHVAVDATAYGNRQSSFNLSLDNTWEDPADNERMIAWTRDNWTRLRDRTGGGVYLNFAGLGEENNLLARAGYAGNYDRLREIKRRYDPSNLFRSNINIAP